MPETKSCSLPQSPAEVDHAIVPPRGEIDQAVIETLDLDPLVMEMIDTSCQLRRQIVNLNFKLPRLRGMAIEAHRRRQFLKCNEGRIELDLARPYLHQQRHDLGQQRVRFGNREQPRP